MPAMTHAAARLAVITAALALAPLAAQQPVVEGKPYFTEPAISPDRSEIAFASGGDLWAVPMAGGDARLLVSHAANESQPEYAPDGKTLAFVSDRTGGGDIYLLTLTNGDLRRLTFDDGNEQLDGWSRDGQWIYYSSSAREIAGNDIYRVKISGGMPMAVSADRFTNEFASAPSPDGQSIAFSARGNGPGQWWRNGHSHLDESEIWLMRGLSTATYRRSSIAAPRTTGRCGAATARACSSCQIAAAPRTSGRSRSRDNRSRSPTFAPAACCGPTSRPMVGRLSSNATSASGRSTWRRDARPKFRFVVAAHRSAR
jgi:hypothetical protein